MLTSLKSCRSPYTWHCHHAAERDTRFYPSRDVATQFAKFESGIRYIFQERVYRSRIHDVKVWKSWKNVCWGSGGCWTTPSSRQRLRNGVVPWKHMFAWMVDILNITCEPLTSCCVLFVLSILFSVNVIDINVQSANIVWNVLLLCLTLSHGMVAT